MQGVAVGAGVGVNVAVGVFVGVAVGVSVGVGVDVPVALEAKNGNIRARIHRVYNETVNPHLF